MALFGPTLANRLSQAECRRIYAFLRDEPLWPLLKALCKARLFPVRT